MFYITEESPYDALRSTVTDRRVVPAEEAENHFGLGIGTRGLKQCSEDGGSVDFLTSLGRTSDIIHLTLPAFPSHT